MRRTEWVLAAFCLFATVAVAQQSHKRGVQGLPTGVVEAMAGDEKDYCDQWLGLYRKGCRDKFRRNLLWRKLLISPSGEEAILVENHNMGACGSAGCSLSLFTELSSGAFAQVLGTQGDVGSVTRIRVLRSVTKRHYELQKTWADQQTRTVYKWNGTRYIPKS